ncbi:MAG: hypothetical protein RL211_1054 [Pseudomonadota bacterium]|jgi:hypothetical protein
MNSDHELPRRGFLALAAWSLASCGGGMGEFAGTPGTGGTGIFSFGSISGFGSVIVNRVRFDDLQATVSMDGNPATAANLRIGMVASVQGFRSTTASLGIANSIEVWSIAQGAVSQVSAGQFNLAGMTLQTNDATVFEGISSVTLLTPGMRLTVWGLQASADAKRWIATRVTVSSASTPTTASTGLVQVLDSQRTLNGLMLTGSLADSLTSGQLARVQGSLSASGDSLLVTRVKLLDTSSTQAQERETEVEGLVTALLSATHFKLGSSEVDASAASFEPVDLPLAVGMRVEVHGKWQAGRLTAAKVEIEDEEELDQVEIEAQINEFTSLSNFMVRNHRCDASGLTVVKNGSLLDIKLGAKVHLKGTKAGDLIKVTQLSFED